MVEPLRLIKHATIVPEINLATINLLYPLNTALLDIIKPINFIIINLQGCRPIRHLVVLLACIQVLLRLVVVRIVLLVNLWLDWHFLHVVGVALV